MRNEPYSQNYFAERHFSDTSKLHLQHVVVTCKMADIFIVKITEIGVQTVKRI